MIQNYIKIAWRNITRQKFISFINIFGLTIGLTCCLLILTYIFNELSYDKFNKNTDRTYRVTRMFYTANGDVSLHLGAVAPPFGPLLKAAFPEIEHMTQIFPTGSAVIQYKEKIFSEENAAFADENFLKVFTLDITKGDHQKALNEPYSVMLTEEIAHKYFGDSDPLNKTIKLDNNAHEFKVTGIFKPMPNNSHMHPLVLMSFATLRDSLVYGEKQLRTNFGNNSFYTYFMLPAGYDAEKLSARLPNFLDKYVNLGQMATVKTSKLTKLTLQKLTDIHLHSHLDSEIDNNGDIKRVYIFSVIAVFILLIACINYMNLSTARSVLRAKEIGIRKVVGAQRTEIIRQFLSESVLITCLALILAVVLTIAALPAINKFSGLQLSMATLINFKTIALIILIPFIIGLISGIYPALFMSSFIPVKVLKGIFKAGSGGLSFRKALVVLQFSISIILIVATTVVFQQLRYMQNISLGFDKDHIITMSGGGLSGRFNAFRQDLLKNPAIREVGRSSRIPSGRLLDNSGASVNQGDSVVPVKADIKYLATDQHFIPVYNIKLAAGRNFLSAGSGDSSNYILNQAAVKMLGWKTADKAIGREMIYGGVKGKVIGVVNDIHFESLHQDIVPMVFAMLAPNSPNTYNRLSIKIDGHNVPAAIATIERAWHQYQPEVPFSYRFLDDRFQKLYSSEQLQGNLFTIFACIAIFIACLGLFGLSAFTISQRFKEIGVRKVLGASVPQIVIELSKDFLKLVLVASVIALPIAWYSMSQWLLDFAFRVSLSWWIFALAGILALMIAFVTIGFQSVKAALANPVKSLRSE